MNRRLIILLALLAILLAAIAIVYPGKRDISTSIALNDAMSTSTRLANDPTYHPIVLKPQMMPRNIEPPEIDPYAQGIATGTLSNFSFEYPVSAHIGGASTEGVHCPNEVIISIPQRKFDALVFISTSPSTACTAFNPNAETLADYETGYRQGDFQEVIDSQDGVMVNGILMLRQVYSHGYWKDGVLGFDLDIGYAYHYVRYVFFDGSKFVMVDGSNSDKYITPIVQSIRLK
jgi:hypothetical protein